jgi:hypothetical protein
LSAVSPFERGGEDKFDAEGPEDVLSLLRRIFGKTEGDGNMETPGNMCVCDARVTTRGIEKGAMAVEGSVLDRMPDNIICGAGLYASGKLHPFLFGVDLYAFSLEKTGEAVQGSMANLFLEGFDAGNKSRVGRKGSRRCHVGSIKIKKAPLVVELLLSQIACQQFRISI